MNTEYRLVVPLLGLLLLASQLALSQTNTDPSSNQPRVVSKLVVIPGQGVLADQIFVPQVTVRPDDKVDFCKACPACCKNEKITFKVFKDRYIFNQISQIDINTVNQVDRDVLLKEQNLLIPNASHYGARPAIQLKAWNGSLEIRTYDSKEVGSK